MCSLSSSFSILSSFWPSSCKTTEDGATHWCLGRSSTATISSWIARFKFLSPCKIICVNSKEHMPRYFQREIIMGRLPSRSWDIFWCLYVSISLPLYFFFLHSVPFLCPLNFSVSNRKNNVRKYELCCFFHITLTLIPEFLISLNLRVLTGKTKECLLL